MNESSNITEAEWQIMRVIWSNVPTTSNYIIEILKDSTDWSPTTIKTLLARLVKKSIISYEAKGRTFYYHALVTEEECIRKEMQLLISRVYGGILNRETPHFTFYGSNIKDYIDDLSNSLESNYERVASDLKYQLTERVTVYIHSSLKGLHSALGALNVPEWLRAGWTWGILHIASPEYFTELPAEKLAVHALAEIIIQKINSSAPYWLHHGISAYESHWVDKGWIKSIIADKVAKNEIAPLKVLMSDYRTFGDNYGYVYAYTVSEFIVEKYGLSKLGMLLRAPNNFLEIFGCLEDKFWEGWVNYLKEYYT